MPDASPSRRAFLAGAASAAVLAAGRGAIADPKEPLRLPTRPFGATGVTVTQLGLGCFPLGADPDDDAGVAIARRALEGGCRYLDTAPTYTKGSSERRVGMALKGWPRDEVFLATKTHMPRTAAHARRDLEESLGRLRVDRVDLIQIHAVATDEDLAACLAPGGPLEALRKARDEGLTRFIGVTGHADPAVMKAAVERGVFDSILFPLNCVDPHHLSFQQGTLPAAVRAGIARIAMKTMASGNLLKKDTTHPGLSPADCLRYVYGLDITCAIVGCASVAEVDLALGVARDPKPLSAAEQEALLASTRAHRGKSLEWYKRA